MSAQDDRTAREKAHDAWGASPPDWVLALADECDRTSQGKVAKRIGRTGGLVSQIINRKYGAGYQTIEYVIRGALMSEAVECPGMGEAITNDVCQTWQGRAKIYAGHNAQRVTMFKACRRCDRFKGGEQS